MLTSVALLPVGHPYLETLKEATRAFNTDKKNLRGNGPEIAKLMPAHERAWVALLAIIADDPSIPEDKKTALKNYVDTTSDRAAIQGTVITCFVKKAYRQKSWTKGSWRIELMTIPELRAVQNEAYQAVCAKPEVMRKAGAPSRNPNVRAVIKTLTDMGEFTAPGGAEDQDI